MSDRLVIIPQPILPAGTAASSRPAKQEKTPSVSFDKVLDDQLKTDNLKFSRHASERMQSRGINFNNEEMDRLSNAVNLVNAKGSRDSLVLLNDTALVVSVKNNTVVTVVDKNSLQGNVFTNIDSAVIA